MKQRKVLDGQRKLIPWPNKLHSQIMARLVSVVSMKMLVTSSISDKIVTFYTMGSTHTYDPLKYLHYIQNFEKQMASFMRTCSASHIGENCYDLSLPVF